MSASFTLTLDTHAPVVTWGEVGGATAGDTLDVRYSSDEPLAVATLRLADGRRLTMAIASDRLTVLLPVDTPAGTAWLTVADDVGNQSPRQAVVLQGVIIIPPQESPVTPGGMPARTPALLPTIVRSRSRVRALTTSRARRRAEHSSTLVADSRSTVRGSLTLGSRARLATSSRVVGTHASASTVRPYVRATVRRRDDPGEEEVLLLAGLL